MNRKPFETDKYYHVYNRGTDKRRIFMDNADYLRFIFAMKEFNTNEPVVLKTRKNHLNESKVQPCTDKPLVGIVAWTLMPNHYHLLIRQVEDGGASKFLQKLITGYSMYFNEKYKRSGVLFQGRTKSVPIEADAQLLQVSRYIHLNPLDLFSGKWKTEGILWAEAKTFLDSYPWSNIKSFSKGAKENEIILAQMESGGYDKFLSEWTEREYEYIRDYIIDEE